MKMMSSKYGKICILLQRFSFLPIKTLILKIYRSSYLNLVLNGLTTIQPELLDQNNIPQWNIIEISPLNLNSLRKNFIISPELWNKNEKKLTELFSIVDNDNN
jgi:hypothetical protein